MLKVEDPLLNGPVNGKRKFLYEDTLPKKFKNDHCKEDLKETKSEASPARLTEEKVAGVSSEGIPEVKETPILCTQWQFHDLFDSKGGTLQPKNSDVKVHIPEGAITAARSITIWGAIYTDLEKTRSELKLPEERFVASPVAEFFAEDDFQFQKPVEIILPHFLPPNTEPESVCVHQIPDGKEGHKIQPLNMVKSAADHAEKLKSDSQKKGWFYLGADSKAHVFVYHFSDICMSANCPQTCVPEALNLRVYGSYVIGEDGQGNVNIRLLIRNNRLAESADFKKDQEEVLGPQGLVLLDHDVLSAYQLNDPTAVGNAAVTAHLKKTDNQDRDMWKPCKDEDGNVVFSEEQRTPLKDFLACPCSTYTRPRMFRWQLIYNQGTAPAPDEFKAFLKIAYSPAPQAEKTLPLIIRAVRATDIAQPSWSPNRTPVQESQAHGASQDNVVLPSREDQTSQ